MTDMQNDAAALEKFVDDRARHAFKAYVRTVARYQPTDATETTWDNLDGVVKLAMLAFAEAAVRYAPDAA